MLALEGFEPMILSFHLDPDKQFMFCVLTALPLSHKSDWDQETNTVERQIIEIFFNNGCQLCVSDF